VRHFRFIRNFEREWKQVEKQQEEMTGELPGQSAQAKGGGGLNLEGALNEYLDDMGEDPYF
jgi:hypothetical protein